MHRKLLLGGSKWKKGPSMFYVSHCIHRKDSKKNYSSQPKADSQLEWKENTELKRELLTKCLHSLSKSLILKSLKEWEKDEAKKSWPKLIERDGKKGPREWGNKKII